MTNERSETTPPHRSRKFRGKKLRTSIPKPVTKPQAGSEAPQQKDANRIAKVMARAGVASRREAEAWIAAGRVSVNGGTIRSPALNVKPSDRIAVDGKPLPQRERTRLFMFHKPRGLVTTSADTHDRPTIYSVLPKGLPRLISIGRLDMNTEGLLLLTNDGGLARALELPATGWLRRYRVRAFGEVTQQRLDELRKGITVDGVNYGEIEATLDRVQGSNVWITFAMREGKNREIRNVLRELGMQVNRLIRVSYGPFQLGEMEEGAIEEVKTRTLREQIGERLAAQAGADFSSDVIERDAREARPAPSRPAPGRPPRGEDGRAPKREDSRGAKQHRDDRQKRDDRPKRDGRPHRGDRAGGGRPHREDGPNRDERPNRGERQHRNERPHGGERPHRGERPNREERAQRGDRPFRSERPHGGDRSHRNERPRGGDRPQRADRPNRDDRPPRGDRPRKGHRPYHGKRDR